MASSHPIRSMGNGGSGDGGVHDADGALHRHVPVYCAVVVDHPLEDGCREDSRQVFPV